MNYLDRNEFNYAPSQEVVEALKNFDINKLCFYTRIYDEGKKSILSVYLSETYGIDEPQVLLGYGGEDILKQAVHYFLTQEDGNKTMLIPKFSWWYYKSIADEVNGRTLQYPLYEDGNTFKYDFAAMKEMVQRENPKVLLIASPNNPTGNGLTPAELDALLAELPVTTIVLVDEAYASFVGELSGGVLKLVNPKIIHKQGRQVCDEGCLSFPDQWAQTVRPYQGTVQALDENGQEIQLTGEGELAQCFCHELDHLDGIVFLQRAIKTSPAAPSKGRRRQNRKA